MAEISFQKDKHRDLTCVTIVGHASLEELLQAIRDFYSGDYTLHAIWDLSNAQVDHINTEQIPQIISLAKLHADKREGGKSVFVCKTELNFGLSRMYETLSEIKNHPIRHGVFKTMEEALHWIDMPDDPETRQ